MGRAPLAVGVFVLLFLISSLLGFLLVFPPTAQGPSVGPCPAAPYTLGKKGPWPGGRLATALTSAYRNAQTPFYAIRQTSLSIPADVSIAQMAAVGLTLPTPPAPGSYPIRPLKCSGWATFPFSSNMGQIEWHLGYASGPNSSFFYYFSRQCLIPSDPSSVLFTWGSITSVQGKVNSEGPVVLYGEYAGREDGSFQFVSDELSIENKVTGDEATLTLSRQGPEGTLQVDVQCPRPPSQNGPDGCAPCIDGMGTSYSSVTRCTWNVRLAREQILTAALNGWIDHQTQGTVPFGRIAPIAMVLGGDVAGLQNVSYMWCNVTLRGDNASRFMITFVSQGGSDGASKVAGHTFSDPLPVRIYGWDGQTETRTVKGAKFSSSTTHVVEKGGPVEFPATTIALSGFVDDVLQSRGLPQGLRI